MTPKKKRIKDMKPEEVHRLTDDEVMERIFNKRVVRKLHEMTREKKPKTGKDQSS